MLRQGVHLREVDNVTASCPPNRMDGESTVEMFVENVIHSELCTLTASHDELSRRLSASSAALRLQFKQESKADPTKHSNDDA